VSPAVAVMLAWVVAAVVAVAIHGRGRRKPAIRLGPPCSSCHNRTRVRVPMADRTFCGRCLADGLDMVEALETAEPPTPGEPPAGGLGAAS
jgi:hypothetical protein